MRNNVIWLVKTALFLALLVVLQAVTKPMGPLVTGSAVNFVLIAATIMVGASSGLVIALASPFLALLLGVVPLPIYIVPVVAVGNAVLVLIYGLILNKTHKSNKKLLSWISCIVVGSVLKFSVLYAGVNWVVVPLMTNVKGGVVKAPAAVFSTQQMLTAGIGGLLALAVVPQVLKAINSKRG